MREMMVTPSFADSEWGNLAARLPLTGPTRELARNITLQSTDDNHWRFLIPDNLAHLSSMKLLDRLGEVLSQELGREVSVTLNSSSGPLETPATVTEQVRQDTLSDAQRSIQDDPTVQTFKERFDAEIDMDSVQPLQ